MPNKDHVVRTLRRMLTGIERKKKKIVLRSVAVVPQKPIESPSDSSPQVLTVIGHGQFQLVWSHK